MTFARLQHAWQEALEHPIVSQGVRAECTVIISASHKADRPGDSLSNVVFGQVQEELALDHTCVVDDDRWLSDLISSRSSTRYPEEQLTSLSTRSDTCLTC